MSHIRVHVLFAGELRNNPLQFPQALGVQTEVQTGVTGGAGVLEPRDQLVLPACGQMKTVSLVLSRAVQLQSPRAASHLGVDVR